MRNLILALILAGSLFIPAIGSAQEESDGIVHRISDKVIIVYDKDVGQSQLAIASERGIVVFDPLWSNIPARAYRAVIAEAFGRDDFAYTVNTVERLDWIGGNETYADTTIIAHENFRHLLTEEAVSAELRNQIELWRFKEYDSGRRLQTEEHDADAEKRLRDWMNACKRRAEELELGFSLRLPDLYYKDRLTLDLGDLTLELIYFGRAGYNAVTVAVIPEEKLAIISGFVMHHHHLAAHPFSHYVPLDIPRWLEVYEEILGEDSPVERVIWGIGAQVWPKERALTRVNYSKKLWERTMALAAEGMTLEQVQEKLSLENEFAFVKELEAYKEQGDDWFRPQHVGHVRVFFLQHKTMATDSIIQLLETSTVEAAVARCRELLDDPGDYYIDEAVINSLGYYLLSRERVDDAVEMFKLNVEAFPESANVYDSLGEAYAARGDTELAIANYRKSLELNPQNENAEEKLRELGAEK